MSLSTIIKDECPKCGKIAIENKRTKFGSSIIISLACGHSISFKSAEFSDSVYDKIKFADGKSPRSYQIDAIKFVERSGFNCIIADEQGLGKTIEILSVLRLHAEELLPAVIVAPTTVKLQWLWEADRVCCPNQTIEERQRFATQVIQSGKDIALPGFSLYITTFDILKKESVFALVKPNIKTIIIDECQRIKNHLSERAKAIQKFAKTVPYKIPMSGTPIKNNAGEYFTVLNLVKPTLFTHFERYIKSYCDSYHNGWGYKVGGLKNPERFHEDTKDIIIRRTKNEVLKDLPELDRKFRHVEFDDRLKAAYMMQLKELEELFYSDDQDAFRSGAAKIAIMSKMRHITGLSKVDPCAEFVQEFLESSERKIVVFHHHQNVAEILKTKLTEILEELDLNPPLMMHSGLNGDERARLAASFKNDDKSRVMIASTLAAGEGINLQFCSDSIMLERQWNPANEEQAEARFHRFGQQNNVSVNYMIAIGTIDEYFTDIVESKRAIVASTLDNKEISWDQPSLMNELTQLLVTKGMKAWSI